MTRIVLLAFLLFSAGCAQKEPQTRATPQAAAPAFAGKVWRVTQSTAVSPGTTYEFRSDGTLVVASPGGTPLEGRWAWTAGALTMTEEGVNYPTDIVALDDSTFSIRSHNPGPPVDITMVRDRP